MTAPRRYHPLRRIERATVVDGHGPAPAPEVDLVADTDVVVEGMQLRPDTRATVAAWAAPVAELVTGGLLLLDGEIVLGRVELGDHVIRHGADRTAEPADGFAARYAPVGADTARSGEL